MYLHDSNLPTWTRQHASEPCQMRVMVLLACCISDDKLWDNRYVATREPFISNVSGMWSVARGRLLHLRTLQSEHSGHD